MNSSFYFLGCLSLNRGKRKGGEEGEVKEEEEKRKNKCINIIPFKKTLNI